jgi:hypothetical protein
LVRDADFEPLAAPFKLVLQLGVAVVRKWAAASLSDFERERK